MRALLDGDIYAYRPAAASENDDLGIAIARMEEMIDGTLLETGSEEFSIYLSGDNNFRYNVYPEYKAQRKKEKPRHLADLKQYLIEKYKAEVSEGCEADDLLGIAQCAAIEANDGCAFAIYNVNPTIICGLDKDLFMIPGNHYTFAIRGTSVHGATWERPARQFVVDEVEGLKTFYTQLLVGDPADNLKGAVGIGKVKAERILADCFTEKDMYEAVESCYSSEEELLLNGQCLWIFRKKDDRWKIPVFV